MEACKMENFDNVFPDCSCKCVPNYMYRNSGNILSHEFDIHSAQSFCERHFLVIFLNRWTEGIVIIEKIHSLLISLNHQKKFIGISKSSLNSKTKFLLSQLRKPCGKRQTCECNISFVVCCCFWLLFTLPLFFAMPYFIVVYWVWCSRKKSLLAVKIKEEFICSAA